MGETRFQNLLEAERVQEEGDGDRAGVEQQQRPAPTPQVLFRYFAQEKEVVEAEPHAMLGPDVKVLDQDRAQGVESAVLDAAELFRLLARGGLARLQGWRVADRKDRLKAPAQNDWPDAIGSNAPSFHLLRSYAAPHLFCAVFNLVVGKNGRRSV